MPEINYINSEASGQPLWEAKRRHDMDPELVMPIAFTVSPPKVNDWHAAIAWLKQWSFGSMREQAGRDIQWVIVVQPSVLMRWSGEIEKVAFANNVSVVVSSDPGGKSDITSMASVHVQLAFNGLSKREQNRLAGIATINVPWGTSLYVYAARRIAREVMGPRWLGGDQRKVWWLNPANGVAYRQNEKALYLRSGGDIAATMVTPYSHAQAPETILDHIGENRKLWPHGEAGTYGQPDIKDPMFLWPSRSGKPGTGTRVADVDWQGIKDRFQLPDRKKYESQVGQEKSITGAVDTERL